MEGGWCPKRQAERQHQPDEDGFMIDSRPGLSGPDASDTSDAARAGSPGQRHRWTRGVFAVLALALVLQAAPAAADPYDPKMAGHPVRIAAYILHPVGVMLDYLILRPAHWLGSKEPLRTLFGHTG